MARAPEATTERTRPRRLVGIACLCVGWVALASACGLDAEGGARAEDAATGGDDDASGDAGAGDTSVNNLDGDLGDAGEAGDAGDAASDFGPSIVAMSVAPTSLSSDYTTAVDGAIIQDTLVDGVFDVTLHGPAIALALIRTNATGQPVGNEVWDTWVTTDIIPDGVSASATLGAATPQLAVIENAAVINDGAGRVSLAAGIHTLRVAASDVANGRFYRLALQTQTGNLTWGPIVAH